MFAFNKLPDAPIIMAILNVTPDSFSDGGVYLETNKAYEKASKDFDDGADIIDIGGESSRPGAVSVSVNVEMKRVIPVIKKIRSKLPNVIISIDTTKPEIACAALNEGVQIVNDITGGSNSDLLKIVNSFEAGLILMHMQGTPKTMQIAPRYTDVTEELVEFLRTRVTQAQNFGVNTTQICVDPGIGFGKTFRQNYEILANLNRFVDCFDSVMLGASRKKFLRDSVEQSNPNNILGATCATTSYGVLQGAKIFRVHDVKENRQAADVAWKIKKYEGSDE